MSAANFLCYLERLLLELKCSRLGTSVVDSAVGLPQCLVYTSVLCIWIEVRHAVDFERGDSRGNSMLCKMILQTLPPILMKQLQLVMSWNSISGSYAQTDSDQETIMQR